MPMNSFATRSDFLEIQRLGPPTDLGVRREELCARFAFAVLNAGDVDYDIACIVARPTWMIFQRRTAGAVGRRRWKLRTHRDLNYRADGSCSRVVGRPAIMPKAT
jgi:hypothetical protein